MGKKDNKTLDLRISVSVLKYIGGVVLSLLTLVLMIYIGYPWFSPHLGTGGAIPDNEPYSIIFNFSLIVVLAIISLYYAKKLIVDSAKYMRPIAYIIPMVIIAILYLLAGWATVFAFGFGSDTNFRYLFALSFSPFLLGVIIYYFLKAFFIARKTQRQSD